MQTYTDDAAGFPSGTYDVAYYELRGDRLTLIPDGNSSVSDAFVARIKLGRNEAARAICRSQPGGRWIYGSSKVAAAAVSQ